MSTEPRRQDQPGTGICDGCGNVFRMDQLTFIAGAFSACPYCLTRPSTSENAQAEAMKDADAAREIIRLREELARRQETLEKCVKEIAGLRDALDKCVAAIVELHRNAREADHAIHDRNPSGHAH